MLAPDIYCRLWIEANWLELDLNYSILKVDITQIHVLLSWNFSYFPYNFINVIPVDLREAQDLLILSKIQNLQERVKSESGVGKKF